MTLLEVIQSSDPLLFFVCFTIGLFVGSFLNVVAYRMPLMMEKGWRRECREFLELDADPNESAEPFNLMVPAPDVHLAGN